MTDVPEPVVLALGSNLGDRMSHLRWAVRRLAAVMEIQGISSVVESDAVGLAQEEAPPDFLNAVVVGETALRPEALLEACHRAEEAAGRSRTRPPASRTLDLDILFFGDRVQTGPGLVLPHPRWKQRGFVLRPLLDVAPDWEDPVSGHTVAEICGDRRDLLDRVRVVDSGEALLG